MTFMTADNVMAFLKEFMLWDGVCLLGVAGVLYITGMIGRVRLGVQIALGVVCANIILWVGHSLWPETICLAPFMGAVTTIAIVAAIGLLCLPWLGGCNV